MHTTEWYIGCSGFHYKEWRNVFYPKGLPASGWFGFYCRHFNTIEINNTFYRFPELKNLQNWYDKTPASFVFSIKVPKIITHQKKFEDTRDLLQEFYDVLLNGLQEKLGPVLFQLPPQFSYSPERLHAITAQLDASFTNVIEFRHISWWRKEVTEELSRQRITFCGVSFPGLIDDVIFSSPFVYYRFHGVPKLYHSSYDEGFLENIVHQIRENKEARKAFLYFNNTASAAAIDNARFVQEQTKGFSV